MEEIIKSEKSYSLTQELFEEMKDASKTFKKGKRILSLLQTEEQKKLDLLNAQIAELKEKQRQIQRAYEYQTKQGKDNLNTRLANFLWLVKNLSFTNVITNDTMASLLSKKTGSDYTFKADIHSSGVSYDSIIWGELKVIVDGKENVLIKDKEHASSLEMCYHSKASITNKLKNKNWFTTWAMRKNGITEKDLENNGFECEYSPVFCKGNQKLDNLMFETIDEYINEKIADEEQQ